MVTPDNEQRQAPRHQERSPYRTHISEADRSEQARQAGATRFQVFLSYCTSDAPQARYVYKRLCAAGICPWFDERDLHPGQSWHDALEQQVSAIPCVAVLIGREGLGPWQREEYKAFWHQASLHGKGLIPVILDTAAGDPVLPPLLQDRIRVDLRGDWSRGFEQLVEAIRSFSSRTADGPV
jgi:hypothetical protein